MRMRMAGKPAPRPPVSSFQSVVYISWCLVSSVMSRKNVMKVTLSEAKGLIPKTATR